MQNKTPSYEPKGLVDTPLIFTKKEKIPTKVFLSPDDADSYVADQIEQLIRYSDKEHVVLGLATGSTPKGMFLAPLNSS